MNNRVKLFFVAAVLLVGFAACSNEEIEPNVMKNADNIVLFIANIGSSFATGTRSMLLGSETEQTKFNEGDEILIAKGISEGEKFNQMSIYRLTNGKKDYIALFRTLHYTRFCFQTLQGTISQHFSRLTCLRRG
ncbi:hypothetical protein [Bacteroides ihuae]|uniref:hypothetical protein n=1 Tax=Bacteroides ihuae TaxID=1852362 RepID=UPI0008DAEC17|nr:hypothetical protein [Bacteroides ihuae]